MARRWALARRWTSEISLAFLDFHRAFLVVVNHAIFAFGAAERNHLVDNFGDGIGVGTYAAGARGAGGRTHASLNELRLSAGKRAGARLEEQNLLAADDRFSFLGKIERNNGKFF